MKKIRKILLVSLYDIPGTERWLEQMANEGLFPAKLGNLGSRRAVFVPNGVPGTRFRIEPGRRDDGNDPYPDPVQREMYREAGWEYAFPFGYDALGNAFFFLYYTTDPSAPELHTDLVTRGMAFARLRKKLWWDVWLYTLLVLLIFFIHFSGELLFGRPPSPFTRFDWFLFVLYLWAYGLALGSNLVNLRILSRALADMRQGFSPAPLGPSPKLVLWHKVDLILSAALILLGSLVLLLLLLHLFDADPPFLSRFYHWLDSTP